MDSTRLNFQDQIIQVYSTCNQITVIAKRRIDIGLLDIASHQGLVRIVCFFCSYIDENALFRRQFLTLDIAVKGFLVKLKKKGHPAKQIFQAIRIEVNDELGAADESIQQAMDMLALDGRISVITFHSLEDRLTKQLFKEASTVEVPKGLPFIPDDLKPKMELVSRKPILPSAEELEANNRSHSAKLRVARKIHK